MTLHQADGLEIHYLTQTEIEALEPETQPPDPGRRHERLRQRLIETGQWGPNQIAGRRWPIGCVSLEITQRCNLDCTLCYLSEHSEAVQDISLEDIFRRIELIYRHYGKDTDVQVSGGDPTLRKRADLVSIVRRITELGMRASLFTNGILATRDLLEDLCAVGLSDVAFHVDMTQQRKDYPSEADLNGVREKYINRARGLPLAVFFNTTIYAGNFAEIPQLVRFFRRHTDVVSLVSFQLQADTGRGILRERAPLINQDSVIEKIRDGAGVALSFDTLAVGHPRCNRYGMAFEINGNLYDFYDDPSFAVLLLQATASVAFQRTDHKAAVRAALADFIKTPRLWRKGARWLGKTLWSARRDLWAAHGRINKLSFVIHNFMDASRLERDRVQACVFMVATAEGPMSMCLYNAKRDRYILPGGRGIEAAHGSAGTDAVNSGLRQLGSGTEATFVYPLKYLKGRARQRALGHAAEQQAETMKRIAASVLLLLQLTLQACTTLVRAPEYPPDPARGAPIEAYARVLARYVNERGEVDFSALARDRADLEHYIAYIAGTPDHRFATRNDRLAHYINSYNALSMYNVLEAGIPETHAGLAKVTFFYLRKLVIGNRRMSLYDYENDVIRPLREPRVHFALNCSALGCPMLPRTPFSGRDLEGELDREARKFFADARNLRVVHASRAVYLSELLGFYPNDFLTAATPSWIAYVNQYLPEPIALDYEVRFIDYDWTIANSRRGSLQ